MSTRKTRLNTDSPTPNSGSESTPSTPNASVQKRLTRKMVDIKAPAITTADETVAAVAATTSSTSIPVAAEVLKKQIKIEQGSPTRKRTLVKTASKDELVPTPIAPVKQPDESKEKDQKDETLAEDSKDKTKRTRRSLIEKRVVPGGTPRKVRKSLPVVLQKDLLKRRSAGRPPLSADRKQSARLNKDIPLRSGRPRKTVTAPLPEKVVRVIRKRARAADKADETTEAEDLDEEDDSDLKPATKMIKQEVPDDEMTSAVSDLESESHRSNSVSKYSDNSSNMDTPLHLLKRDEDNVVVVKEEPKDVPSEVEETEENTEEIDAKPILLAEVVKPTDDVVHNETIDAKTDVIEPSLIEAPLLVVEQESIAETSTKPLLDAIDKATESTKTTVTRISQKTPTSSPNTFTRPKRALVRPKFSSPAVAAVAPVVDESIVEAIVNEIQTKVEDSKAQEEEEKPTCNIAAVKDLVLADPPVKTSVSDPEEYKNDQEVATLAKETEETYLKKSQGEPECEHIKDESLTQPITPIEPKIPNAEPEIDPNPITPSLTPPNSPLTQSPSPVLSLGVASAISVKSFYGQPDFLENNPGIEDDPKLRDIVKEHTVIDEEMKDDVKMEIENVKCDEKPIVEEEIKPVDGVSPKEQKSKSPTPIEELNKIEVTQPPVNDTPASLHENKKIEPSTVEQIQDVQMTDPDNKENLIKAIIPTASLSPNRAPLAENPKDPQDIPESPEKIRQKENHFLKLGLLTHHAAKIEKQKRRESIASNSGKSVAKKTSEYTGTLKTIIKLNRPSTGSDGGKGKKTGRQSGALKMTLHKARGKGGLATATASSSSAGGTDAAAHATDEETYYTIQTEAGENADAVAVHGGQSRKSLNRSHTIDGTIAAATAADSAETMAAKEAEALLVIPEKASSFRIHPDKLCQDQCFYCGGKFGLFDTPCHVAGIKSLERQRKILENEEKLTVDNCLCDACFRHVDRRANCPMYKKRTSKVVSTASSEYSKMHQESMAGSSKTNSGDEAANAPTDASQVEIENTAVFSRSTHICHVAGCDAVSAHSIRRKWFIKMKRQIGKLLQLTPEAGTAGGGGMLSICGEHYNVIGHLMVCTLCKRKLVRNHIYYINQDVSKLEQLLADVGISVTIGSSPVVCKLCRYFSNLLLKPPDKPPKTAFVKEYRRRLLQFYNVDAMEDTDESQPPSDQPIELTQSLTQNTDQSTSSKKRSAKRQRKSSRNEDALSVLSSVESNAADDEDRLSVSPSTHLPGPSISVDPEISNMTAKILADYEQSQSISILPRSKNAVPVPKAQVILVETGDTQHTKEDLSALRANPNISMRELFPGEEEMGLHVNVPFGTVGSQRTPEGWTKCQTTIQYDDQTRNLWEELQKPYGNQSSFLRHLILLEKYFRNGDLVLSGSANCSAVNYAGSVQQRLQSYDNKSQDSNVVAAASALSLLSSTMFANSLHPPNSAISITPTGNIKSKPKSNTPEIASTSLLKTNRISIDSKPKEKAGNPPELISITTISKQPTLVATLNSFTSNSSPSVSASSSPTNLTTTKSPKSNSLLLPQNQQSKPATKQTKSSADSLPKASSDNNPPPVIRLPDVLTPAERLESKMWRPTLMPVSAGPPALNGQLYQTADGRKLPNLVQVQSGGNPYLISIHDYNRMCILRRERLLRDQMMQRHQQQSGLSGGASSSASSSNAPSMNQPLQTSTPKSSSSSSSAMNSKSKSSMMNNNVNYPGQGKVQIPNKILEQNSLIPLNNAGSSGGKGVGGALDSLLKIRKPNPTSLLKHNNSGGSKSNSSSSSNIISITSTPSIAAILGVSTPPSSVQQQQQLQQNQQMLQNQQFIQQQFLQQQMAYQQMASGSRGMGMSGHHITPNVTATLSGSWPMESMLKSSQALAAGAEISSLSKMWSWAESLNKSAGGGEPSAGSSGSSMDASLLSKIPKSLTVIPQQKDRRSFSGKSATTDGNRSS